MSYQATLARLLKKHAKPLHRVVQVCYELSKRYRAKYKYRYGLGVESSIGVVSADWQVRIEQAMACPDNDYIPRVRDAGKVIDKCVVMHNGLRVHGHSYIGAGMMNLLVRNRGVHEPQEERVFREVVKVVSEAGVILELGSYWGFYSLWFLKEVRDGRAYLVEPDIEHLVAGQENFRNNQYRGTFRRAYIGSGSGTSARGIEIISVDEFCKEEGIEHLDVLHSDIQGSEYEMLCGARDLLSRNAIDFLFVSTHSNELHNECRQMVSEYDYEIIASANCDESYSVDGVLVAQSIRLEEPGPIAIARRNESSKRGQASSGSSDPASLLR